MTQYDNFSIKQCLYRATARLAPVRDSARLDAELLLMRVTGFSRATLHAWPEREVPQAARARFEDLVERRARGEPVAYLVGEREFWSLPLKVTPDTLIPRPETELLVEQALARVPPEARWRIADLGTGSGAIALAIAHERPNCQVVATDASAATLAVAQENATRLGLANVTFRQGSWFEPLRGERYELIVSNPPYVAEDDPHLERGDLPFEPGAALAAGPDGLRDLRHIVGHAADHLTPEAWLLLEHGWDQGPAVAALLKQQGFAAVGTLNDLAGQDRISLGRLAKAMS